MEVDDKKKKKKKPKKQKKQVDADTQSKMDVDSEVQNSASIDTPKKDQSPSKPASEFDFPAPLISFFNNLQTKAKSSMISAYVLYMS
jgi:hypothetical protein